MGFLSHLLYPWGLLLQGFAIVHFIRRRPDMYWFFIILFLGPLGALVYIFVEVIPDLGLLRQSFKVFPRRKRISELETMVRDNPSSGNYEELGDLYMDDGKLPLARAAFASAAKSTWAVRSAEPGSASGSAGRPSRSACRLSPGALSAGP